jgi:hypothetical protein
VADSSGVPHDILARRKSYYRSGRAIHQTTIVPPAVFSGWIALLAAHRASVAAPAAVVAGHHDDRDDDEKNATEPGADANRERRDEAGHATLLMAGGRHDAQSRASGRPTTVNDAA